MKRTGRLTSLLFLIVPGRWRESVRRDLMDEAALRPPVLRHLWIAWQVLRIAVRLWKPFANVGGDVRLGARALLRQPWSSLSIALTLALGIGAATAIYAAFNYAMFRPVPGVVDEASLVTVHFMTPDQNSLSGGDLSGLPALRQVQGISGIGFAYPAKLAVSVPSGTAVFEEAEFVTGGLFRVLGVRARAGRLLTDEEAESGARSVVVSERLWRARLGGQRDAIGRVMTINGHAFTVVGVAEAYRGWGWTRAGITGVWLPVGAFQFVTGQPLTSMWTPVARIRPGMSREAVEQQMRAAYEPVRRGLPETRGRYVPTVFPGLYQFLTVEIDKTGLPLYWMLMGGVALLLLLACANAANMILTRSARHMRDTAVRLAMGATRWRIVRQSLVESSGLAAAAGALGLGVGALLLQTFGGFTLMAGYNFPELQDVEMDARVLTFCVLVTTTTVMVFALLPALVTARADARGVLARGGRSMTAPHRLRHGLVVLQIAVSLALVAGAGVLNRSLQNLFSADLGMRLGGVLQLSLTPQDLGYDDRRSADVLARTVDAMRRAGFTDVALSFPAPLQAANRMTVQIKLQSADTPARKVIANNRVTPDYFNVLGIRLLAGRTLAETEYGAPEAIEPMPVVVNAAFARDVFAGQDAVGRTFYMRRDQVWRATIVVGVVDDIRKSDVRRAPVPAIYHGRTGWRDGHVLLRAAGPAGEAIERVRAVVHGVDPNLPITRLAPLEDDIAESLSQDRLLARLGAIVAALAAALAAAGVFSVVTQLVTERSRDFGIRTALGATSGNIVRDVLFGVVARAVIGAAGGVALYWLTSRWLQTRLFGLDPLDPLTIALAVLALVGVSVIAACYPALRAARIDPALALRAE